MGVIEFATVAPGGMIVARPCAERTEPVNIACAATVAEHAQVVGEHREGGRWHRKPGHSCVDVDRGGNVVMHGIGGGADWEQRECPNRLVRRPSAPN